MDRIQPWPARAPRQASAAPLRRGRRQRRAPRRGAHLGQVPRKRLSASLSVLADDDSPGCLRIWHLAAGRVTALGPAVWRFLATGGMPMLKMMNTPIRDQNTPTTALAVTKLVAYGRGGTLGVGLGRHQGGRSSQQRASVKLLCRGLCLRCRKFCDAVAEYTGASFIVRGRVCLTG